MVANDTLQVIPGGTWLELIFPFPPTGLLATLPATLLTVYDARQLLADVARMVEKQKADRDTTQLPEIEFPAGRR